MTRISRHVHGLLLSTVLFSTTLMAQDSEAPAAPELPELAELSASWWSYFDGTPEQLRPKVVAFLERANQQVAELAPRNQDLAPGIVEAVADNFEVYLSLLEDVDIQTKLLPEPEAGYSLDDLLSIAATSRGAREAADAGQNEVEREQRILSGAQRRRVALFKEYLGAAAGDQRWLTGLRLVRARSEQAIAARRLEILTQDAADAAEFADSLDLRIELVRERLATAADEATLAELDDALGSRETSVRNAEEQAREAQILASNIGVDSAQGRSEQRLQQQRALDSEVELALRRVELAETEARQLWTLLKIGRNPDLSLIEDKTIGWSELVRQIRGELPDWQLQTEDELLAAQGVDRDALDRTARRILDQRNGTAQETLGHVGDLKSAAADLTLLISAVDDASSVYSSGLQRWLNSVDKTLRTGWIRVSEKTGMTLFSVSETPVTIGDILRAIAIFFFGWLLSRLVRFLFRRVGRNETQSTQASLYTLSRLTHYTIIIVAVIVALASIGLSFTNLALVAGALSVGIGFGLQSIVNNFVSGLIILFEHTLRVGDYIELDTGLTGTVKAINVRSTLINTNDNIDIVVPNSEFVSTKLTNWTLAEHFLRVRIPFGVAYGSDKELVRKAAIEACDDVSYTLTNMRGREPDVWLVEFGDNSLNFLLLVWVNRQGARRPTRTRAAYLWALETKLNEYGIEIPFPQRDLHLRSGWPVADESKG